MTKINDVAWIDESCISLMIRQKNTSPYTLTIVLDNGKSIDLYFSSAEKRDESIDVLNKVAEALTKLHVNVWIDISSIVAIITESNAPKIAVVFDSGKAADISFDSEEEKNIALGVIETILS